VLYQVAVSGSESSVSVARPGSVSAVWHWPMIESKLPISTDESETRGSWSKVATSCQEALGRSFLSSSSSVGGSGMMLTWRALEELDLATFAFSPLQKPELRDRSPWGPRRVLRVSHS